MYYSCQLCSKAIKLAPPIPPPTSKDTPPPLIDHGLTKWDYCMYIVALYGDTGWVIIMHAGLRIALWGYTLGKYNACWVEDSSMGTHTEHHACWVENSSMGIYSG